MKCQLCSKEATVHLTDIVNNKKKELHLCQSCAESHNLIKHQEMNFSTILQTLIGQHVDPKVDELARLKCPACGIRYMEFRTQGRLGCPHDYSVFRMGLLPLVERIHRSTLHTGKAPRRYLSTVKQAELMNLRRELQEAVAAEQFEEAARIRDLLREKESSDGPQ